MVENIHISMGISNGIFFLNGIGRSNEAVSYDSLGVHRTVAATQMVGLFAGLHCPLVVDRKF